ncbi:MAG: hypothetical protein IKE94_11005 [Aeriscardovia sp.]|nr:hypothetical protein [Aeriscardovia sp.]
MSEEEKRIAVTGKCKYCGQYVVLMMPENATEEEIELAALNSCKCQEGEAARLKYFNKHTIDAWIDEKYEHEEGLRDLLHECADAIIWESVDQISVKRNEVLDAFTVKTTTLTLKRDSMGKIIMGQNTAFKKSDKF